MPAFVGRLVLLFAGLLLLFAAGTKALALAGGSAWSWRTTGVILQVQMELLLGLWFLSGLKPKAAWWVALGLFSLFALYAGYLIFLRAPSCGCFGNLQVKPWVTFFLDLAIICGLLGWPPVGSHRPVQRATALRWLFVFLALNGLGLLYFWWSTSRGAS